MSDQRNGGQPSELTLRVISALVLIALVLGVTWLGGTAFAVFCALVSAIVLYEFLKIVRKTFPDSLGSAAFAGFAIVVASGFVYGEGNGALLALAGAVSVVLLLELFESRRIWSAAGLAYTALPFLALIMLRGDEPIGLHAVFLLFACVWGTDSAAYFAGRAIGGPKLAPAISPKKTWSGCFGGIAGALIAGFIILYLAGYAPGMAAGLLCVLLSIVSQIGDLIESWIKRRFDVKDSGTLIPGHGGMFDRIDGLITASVAAWLAGGYAGGEWLSPGAPAKGLFAAFILP